MSSDFQVILDACVLVNAALRDTLLRLAEPPCSLYLPRWSKDIIEETRRTLETKLGLTPAQTAHLLHQLEVPLRTHGWMGTMRSFRPWLPLNRSFSNPFRALNVKFFCNKT